MRAALALSLLLSACCGDDAEPRPDAPVGPDAPALDGQVWTCSSQTNPGAETEWCYPQNQTLAVPGYDCSWSTRLGNLCHYDCADMSLCGTFNGCYCR